MSQIYSSDSEAFALKSWDGLFVDDSLFWHIVTCRANVPIWSIIVQKAKIFVNLKLTNFANICVCFLLQKYTLHSKKELILLTDVQNNLLSNTPFANTWKSPIPWAATAGSGRDCKSRNNSSNNMSVRLGHHYLGV